LTALSRLSYILGRLTKQRVGSAEIDERLVTAAARLFRQEGFDATTLRQIAKAAGMLPGSVHYRYPTKAALLLALMRRGMEADLACPGLAIIGDPYYPGWRAFVDGRRTVVQEVEGVRAVRADAGRHTIEFRYRPSSVYWGAGLALAGLILAAFVTIFVK
jgi:AcrR family transcriptional regulator